jgi:hypothetical protein
MLPNDWLVPHPPNRVREAKASLARCMFPLDTQDERYILSPDDQEEGAAL